jgi:hypothetical protein
MRVTEKTLLKRGWIGKFASDKQIANAMRNAQATEDIGYSHELYMYDSRSNALYSIKPRGTVFGWGKDSNGNVSASNGAIGYGIIANNRMIFTNSAKPRRATLDEEQDIQRAMPRPAMGQPPAEWQINGPVSVHEIWPRDYTSSNTVDSTIHKLTPDEADEAIRSHLAAIHNIMSEQET